MEKIIISPDGIPIDNDSYKSLKEIKKAWGDFKKRYEHFGYYASVEYGRIPLNKLHKYCYIQSF